MIDRSRVKCLSHLGLELTQSVGHEASLIPANPKSYAHMNDIIKRTKKTIIERIWNNVLASVCLAGDCVQNWTSAGGKSFGKKITIHVQHLYTRLFVVMKMTIYAEALLSWKCRQNNSLRPSDAYMRR